MEPDPDDASWEFLVAYPDIPLDPLIIGDVGAIVNSMRSALDLLMYAVLARRTKKPETKRGLSTHFPIRDTATNFLDYVDVLEVKQRITSNEATAIKKTKAYKGVTHFCTPSISSAS
jgi:hypothetical protein